MESALPSCAQRVLSISAGQGGVGRALCGAGRASLFINHYHSGEKALESSNKYEVSADGALLIRWIRKIYLLGYISN